MITSIQFGDYILSSVNNVNVNVIRDKSAAESAIGLLQPARARGIDVVSIVDKGKIIEIEGTISHSGSAQTYTDAIRDFVAVFQIQADLLLGASDGLFVYENCVVLNRDNVLRDEAHWNIDFIRFSLQILAPDGVAVATSLTNNSFDNITSSPYTNEISIGGSANPQPIITLTLDSVGAGVGSMSFLNRTTNESISVATQYNSDDIVQIDTKNKQVLYNTRVKRFTGLFPQFQLGKNRFKIDVESSGTLHQSQTSSNSDRSVQGNTWLSQRINPDTTISASQIELLVSKTEAPQTVLSLYDDFNDNSLDTDKWGVSVGTVNETNNELQVKGNTGGSPLSSTVDTNNKTGGDPIVGAKWSQAHIDGTHGGGGDFYAEVTDGTNLIRIEHNIVNNTMFITLNGTYGSGSPASWSATGGSLEIVEVGSDIQVKFNNSVKHTISGVLIEANSNFRCFAHTAAPGGVDHLLRVNNVQFYTADNGTAITDLILEIQTNSAGDPSGTPVTNATTTIKVADISDSFTIIPAIFSNAPSLSSGVDYHIVANQTGGDANNYYSIKINTAGGYSQGEVSVSTDAGSNWTDQSEDMWFKLYGAFASDFNLDVDLDHFVTHYSLA